MKRFLTGLLFLGVICTGTAAPLTRDLGEGLVYLRAADLPADFSQPACVLDLRYAQTDAASVPALVAWMKSRSAAQQVMFVLVNHATAHAVVDALAHHAVLPGLLTLGPKLDDYTPDIIVPVDTAEEQRAYAALPDTADISTLLEPAPAKVRHDEAAIEKAMNAGDVPEPASEPAIAPETLIDPEPDTPAPPVDRTLQRAVHIHRGWLALPRSTGG